MRLILITTMFLALLFPIVPVMAGEASAGLSYDVKVEVDGDQVAFPDQKPFINTGTGRTYVPLRFVTEKLGATVNWNQQEKVAIVEKSGNTVQAPVGSNAPTVNGQAVYLDAPVRLINARTVVPLRFMSETLGTEVKWDSSIKTVYIKVNQDTGEADVSPGSVVEITAAVLNVRSGPGTSTPEIGEVVKGDKLTVFESSQGWYKVELSDGSMGWVSGRFVKVDDAQDSPGVMQAVVDATNVNIRSGPGTDHNIIGKVDRGERLGILEQTGNWFKVELVQGGIGWIADQLINIEEAEATTPLQEEQIREELENNQDGGENYPPPSEEKEEEETDWQNFDSTVAGLEVGEDDGATVATVNTDGSLEHHIFTLTNPDRLVVDLKGVKPGDLAEEINVNSELVKRIRTSKFSENPNIVRLVFDVKEPVMFTATKSKNKDGAQLTLKLYVPNLGTHLKGKTIAIDPGHGGSDPGAIGSSGLKEKDVNINVGLLTANLLRQNGAEVVLTRSTDAYVDLYQRTEIAAKGGADVFVSIHMNAHPKRGYSGTSTYYRRDNISVLGVSQADNRLLAQQVHSQLMQSLNRRDVGIKQANFVVLRTAAMPAVLVEASFISNLEEEKLLSTDSYRAKIAEAIAKGLAHYFAKKTG